MMRSISWGESSGKSGIGWVFPMKTMRGQFGSSSAGMVPKTFLTFVGGWWWLTGQEVPWPAAR
jgi:hypothetical protein